ncbi:hypothetical protein H3V53_06395 [Paraburkholderia bengalensis]|uniref:C1q domain-containing protein n=1 Tax=Paraburkholderia bengalensis TaxID=2747562 RepID=A0ABU8INE7_9BURK
MTNTSTPGQIIEMTGNGATTPNKFLGVVNGVLNIYSSSGATQLLSLDDSGNMTVTGAVHGVNSKVIASNSTSQSIATSTQTTITGWTATMNQGSNFVASTGVYTAPAAGTYDIRAAIALTPASSVIGAQIILEATVNGVVVQSTTLSQQLTGNTFQNAVSGAFRVICNSGDLITLRVFQTTGASMTLNGVSTANWLSIEQEP